MVRLGMWLAFWYWNPVWLCNFCLQEHVGIAECLDMVTIRTAATSGTFLKTKSKSHYCWRPGGQASVGLYFEPLSGLMFSNKFCLWAPSLKRVRVCRHVTGIVGCACLIYTYIIYKLIIIIIFINCNWVVTRWQWLFYMYTEYEIG